VFEAAAFGRLERLAEILDADPAQANAFSADGFTPLHLACFSGGAGATALLVERGAELETISRAEIAQVRPLGTAAFSGDVESARVLLEAGADPNGAGGGGGTPLQAAQANRNETLVELLRAHGAEAGSAGVG
jgi:ankyrin repeat protein